MLLSLATLLAFVPPVRGADSKPFHIYMAVWRGEEEAVAGFRDYLTERGVPYRMTLRNAAQDKSKLPGFVAEAKKLRPDLVITWGTTVSLGLLGAYDDFDPSRHITSIPAVFMIVSQPVRAKLVRSFESSGRPNITGTRYLLPVEAQVAVARRYFPRFRRIGMVYNRLEHNARISLADLTALGRKMDFAVEARAVPLRNGMPDPAALPGLVAEMAAANVDLIYFGADSFLTRHLDTYTQAVLDAGLPIVAAGEHPVRNGKALLGIGSSYYDVGRYTAFRAMLILIGKEQPGNLPITPPSNPKLIVNLDVAEALNRPPPEALARVADLVRN